MLARHGFGTVRCFGADHDVDARRHRPHRERRAAVSELSERAKS